MKPRILITMGDPGGIGPEVALAAIAHPEVTASCCPVILGHYPTLSRTARQLNLPLPQPFSFAAFQQGRYPRGPAIISPDDSRAPFPAGTVTAETGQASFDWIVTAIRAALDSRCDAVTTGPIHKEALRAAGIDYPGHTEIFTELTGAEETCMMQFSDVLTCSFVTTHIGYADVPRAMTTERIAHVIRLTADALVRLKGKPRHALKLTVCGLNPHAGEHGLFGAGEEQRIIQPAIDRLRQTGLDVSDPLPPDTCFIPQHRQTVDAVICMYHDQGHIPLKALAFDRAVNVTLGLPIIRTSVDHGTALAIAGQGIANPSSMIQAIRLASRMAVESGPRS